MDFGFRISDLSWRRKRVITLGLVVASLSLAAYAQSRQTATRETFDQWMTELSNWGRWGKDDELGAINLITPAKRKQAAGLVKEGASFSLARDAEKEKAVDNPVPFVHQMTRTGVNNPGTSVATCSPSPTTAAPILTWIRYAIFSTRARCTTAIRRRW